MNGIFKSEFLLYICNIGEELNIFIDEFIYMYNNICFYLSLVMKIFNFRYKKIEELMFYGFF